MVEAGSLFDEGIKSWLGQVPGLQLLSVPYTSDAAFTTDVLGERPDVIMLFEDGPLSVGQVFELLKGDLTSGAFRVITVLSESSIINIYEKKQFTAINSDDLVTLIQYS